MIKNIIFDFGQVLVRFDPEYMTSKYLSDKDDIKTVSAVIFDRLYWDKLDKGTIDDEQVISLSNQRLDEKFHSVTEKIYYNWIYNIPEIEGMRSILEKLKEKGVRLFLLSNISKYFATHSEQIDILSYFEKCIFSAVCGYTKPNTNIFCHTLKECEISPEETLFVDDNSANIEGAKSAGIHSFLFDGDAKKLEEYLETQKIL